MTENNTAQVIKDMTELDGYALATMADCSGHPLPETEGFEFLDTVRGNVVQWCEDHAYMVAGDDESDAWNYLQRHADETGFNGAIADSVPVWHGERFHVANQLHAWNEDIEGGAGTLTEAVAEVLDNIARRLATALMQWATEQAE